MSVYYNLFKQNNEMKLQDPVKFNEVSFMPILKNQGDYLVGVKRFKIPSQGIDRFRLYPDRYYLGMTMPVSTTHSAGFRNPNTVAFDLINCGDADNFMGLAYDDEQKQNYIPINSNNRLCEIFNRTIAQSFLGRYNLSGLTQTPTASLINTSQTIAPSVPGTAIELAAPQAGAGAGTKYQINTQYGDVYTGYEFELNAINNLSTPTGVKIPLSNLVIEMTVPRVENETAKVKTVYIPFFENVGNNVYLSDFNTIFPQGLCICSYGKVSVAELQLLNKNKPFSQKLFVCPNNNTDLTHMIAQYRNAFVFNSTHAPSGSMAPSIHLRLLNRDNVAGLPATATTFDLNYAFRLYTQSSQIFGVRQNINQYAYKTPLPAPPPANPTNTCVFGKEPASSNQTNSNNLIVPFGLPHFSNESGDLLTLTIPNWMFYEKCGGIFMSNGLAELTNFSCIDTSGLTANDYYQSSIEIMTQLGISGALPTRNYPTTSQQLGTFINSGDLNPQMTLNNSVLTESRSSNYKRSYLWGLQIRSNNLSTSGEFVSGGRSFQKVLTDFVIDPSTNQGDYLLFEPEEQRFYPLNASGELRQLDVSVYIVDMNNNTSVLNLPPNTSLSLKIEFRPKNMVYNYVDNSTMS